MNEWMNKEENEWINKWMNKWMSEGEFVWELRPQWNEGYAKMIEYDLYKSWTLDLPIF